MPSERLTVRLLNSDDAEGMHRELAERIEKLLESAAPLCIPIRWLQATRNHTAAILLADILASYLDAAKTSSLRPSVMDGAELLLEYKPLAKKLALSNRSISRAVDYLVRVKALRRTRKDRKVNGKWTRNVVGVIPNLDVITELSGITLNDKLSAHAKRSFASRSGRATSAEAHSATERPVLTGFQAALRVAYEAEFLEIVGEAYRPGPKQDLVDDHALIGLQRGPARGGGREYTVWARQYLEALKSEAEKAHGEVQQAAYDRFENVKARFTLESFIVWAKTDEPLPNGRVRRSFR